MADSEDGTMDFIGECITIVHYFTRDVSNKITHEAPAEGEDFKQ